MLDFRAIEAIADRIAKNQVSEHELKRVLARSIVDSEGNDALRVTVVLTPKAVEELSGDAALELLSELQRALEQAGEERLTIVEYATESEMREEAEDEKAAEDEEDSGVDET